MKADKIILKKRIYEILQEEAEENQNDTAENSEENNTEDNNEKDSDKEQEKDENDKTDSDGDEKDSEDDKKDDKKNDEEDGEEEFSAESFGDFLKKTNTKVKISKISCEPSPIFGPNDTSNHNKYKITISNEKGSVWFYFWDSIRNTTENKTPKTETVMADFGNNVSSVKDGVSLEEFENMFGYDETDNDISQRAYDGCRKMVERAKKLFEEKQIEELIRLANDY